MDSFSISELAQYSGIKPHTIRIWEKRYKALKPERTSGNTRYYDNSQLRRLLNITSLMDSENKISDLCEMPDEKLEAMNWKQLHAATGPEEYFVAQLISAALTYDEPNFVNIFSHCLLRFGMKDTYIKVLYPVLVRLGLMWLNGSLPTANEHFISNLIRQKLFTAIDSLPPGNVSEKPWVLFLPENEFHEIGLLLAHYLIRLAGRRVIYLGPNVPFYSLKQAILDLKAEYLLSFIVHRDFPKDIQKYLDQLSSDFNGEKIYVAADPRFTNGLKTGRKLHFLDTAEALELQLQIHTV